MRAFSLPTPRWAKITLSTSACLPLSQAGQAWAHVVLVLVPRDASLTLPLHGLKSALASCAKRSRTCARASSWKSWMVSVRETSRQRRAAPSIKTFSALLIVSAVVSSKSMRSSSHEHPVCSVPTCRGAYSSPPRHALRAARHPFAEPLPILGQAWAFCLIFLAVAWSPRVGAVA